MTRPQPRPPRCRERSPRRRAGATSRWISASCAGADSTTKSTNADVARLMNRPARCTTYQRRISGRPTTSSSTSRRVCSSSPIVCREISARPIPAITACLIVSLLLITLPIFGTKRRSAKKRSIDERVPEPCSRTRNVCPASAGSGMRRAAASGLEGSAMMTSGWSANGVASVSSRCGGTPMIATSISLRSSSRTMISRLFTDSDARTPG